MHVLRALDRFFTETAPLSPGDVLVVAFSGGPDSTALLWGACELGIRVHAAHLDHAADPGSAARARAAETACRRLGVPVTVERRPVPAARAAGESLEAAGRRLRYELLDEVRRATGARYVATAHHADDQAETLLLRLLQGSGLAGLAGIQPVYGRVVRPLLTLPRRDLAEALREAGIEPLDDPTNRDLTLARNAVRHRLLPKLTAEVPELARRLPRLAGRVAAARERLTRLLAERLPTTRTADGVAVERRRLEALPDELLPWALDHLHRLAGAPYPAGSPAQGELLRQLRDAEAGGGRVGCDCGDGFRWESRGRRLTLARGAAVTAPADFTYTLEVPGAVAVAEISSLVRLTPATFDPWMLRGAPDRAGLALPLSAGARVEVRNRRPGDRIRPLGAPGGRRLKEVLIDHLVPRERRDRLPLLVVDGRIAWVPGVTIDEAFRLREGSPVWLAEVVAAPGPAESKFP